MKKTSRFFVGGIGDCHYRGWPACSSRFAAIPERHG